MSVSVLKSTVSFMIHNCHPGPATVENFIINYLTCDVASFCVLWLVSNIHCSILELFMHEMLITWLQRLFLHQNVLFTTKISIVLYFIVTTFLVVIIKGHSRSEIIGILFKCVVCHIVTLFVKIQRHSSPKKYYLD